MLKPEEFFYILSDPTRLRCLLLLQAKSECCVCDFSYALQIIQPKISRHLAILRGANVVSGRRAGAWIYYSIHPNLPTWAFCLLTAIAKETTEFYSLDLLRLNERNRTLCKKASLSQESSQENESFSDILPQNLLPDVVSLVCN